MNADHNPRLSKYVRKGYQEETKRNTSCEQPPTTKAKRARGHLHIVVLVSIFFVPRCTVDIQVALILDRLRTKAELLPKGALVGRHPDDYDPLQQHLVATT